MGEHVDPYRLYLHYPHELSEAEAGGSAHDLLVDYYGIEEESTVREEIYRLFEAFRTEVYFGQRHYAPSPSWRDELTTRQSGVPMPQRFVVRLHLFEKREERTTGRSVAGRYMGFVSLRPPRSAPKLRADGPGAEQAFRYLIDAELTTPSYMQRPR